MRPVRVVSFDLLRFRHFGQHAFQTISLEGFPVGWYILET